MAKFEIRKSTNGQYWFRLVANNGNVICSTETYVNKEDAKNAIQFVKVNAADASVHDLTK